MRGVGRKQRCDRLAVQLSFESSPSSERPSIQVANVAGEMAVPDFRGHEGAEPTALGFGPRAVKLCSRRL